MRARSEFQKFVAAAEPALSLSNRSAAKTVVAGVSPAIFYFAGSDFRRRMISAIAAQRTVYCFTIRKHFCNVGLQYDDVASPRVAPRAAKP